MNIDSKNDPFVCGNQSSKSYLAGSMLIYWWWIHGKFIVITPFSMGIAFRKGFWHVFQGEWLVIYGKLMIDGWELEHHNGTSTVLFFMTPLWNPWWFHEIWRPVFCGWNLSGVQLIGMSIPFLCAWNSLITDSELVKDLDSGKWKITRCIG